MTMSQDPINFSKTERLVLVIDIQPILRLENPNPYITAIISSAETLLRFPPLSSTLFAFKLFFSSVSPLLPISPVIRSLLTSSLSFNNPSHILSSLIQTLNSLPLLDSAISQSLPKLSHFPESLIQVAHDYPWHLLVNLPRSPNGLPAVPSNLVVLFSHFYDSLKCVSQHTDLDCELLRNGDAFGNKFVGVFSRVSKAFKDKNIHCCWVDVKCGLGCEDDDIVKLGHYERGIRRLGWGFCSTESIVFGSALVHFGLIYPKIGVLLGSLNSDAWCKLCHAKLSLEILDVNRRPLECNLFDLDLYSLKKMPTHTSTQGWLSFLSQVGDGIVKLHIRAVQKYKTCIRAMDRSSEVILVRGSSLKSGDSSDFFADRILEMLSTGSNELFQKTAAPIWQILLSFLYRQGYWASVFLSKGNEISCRAVLKPFTSHSALIFVMDNECFSGNEIPDLQSSTSPSKEHQALADGNGIHWPRFPRNELKRSSLYNEAFEHPNMVLEEIYFRRTCSIPKKLKFLKCWMKQTKRSSCIGPSFPYDHLPHVVNLMEAEEKSNGSNQNSDQYVSSTASKGGDSITESSTHGAASESFFSTLSEKIEEGIRCAELDMGVFAKRLVEKCIQLLYQKYDATVYLSNSSLLEESEQVSVLSKLLILAPKDLAAKHKECHLSASENLVREYELQICFRMEILQSLATGSTLETTTPLFVKEISSLLEKIQLHLEDEFFGGTCFEEYVGKTIKSRYGDKLGDVVHKIYEMADLYLFDEEEEAENSNNDTWDNHRSCEEKKETEEDESLDRAYAQVLVQAQQKRELDRRRKWSRSSMKDLRRVFHPRRRHGNQNPNEIGNRKRKQKPIDARLARVRAPSPRSPVEMKKQKCDIDVDEICGTPIVGNVCWTLRGGNTARRASKALFRD